jgi:hypothetical protein
MKEKEKENIRYKIASRLFCKSRTYPKIVVYLPN